VLEPPEHRALTIEEVCARAGYASATPWKDAVRDATFVAQLEFLGVKARRRLQRPS